MDELELSGKRYISTRRAGRENGYHSDYIGQLIRGGKVVGQKVGRSWYVDEESLAVYLGKAYTPPASTTVQDQPTTSSPVAPAQQPIPSATPVIEIPVQQQQVPVAAQPAVAAVPQSTQAPVETYTVPVHVQTQTPTAQPKPIVEEKASPVGLRYVEDDKDTMLPVVTRMPEEEYIKEQLIPPMPAKRSSKVGRLALIGAAMVLVVGVGIAASAFLNVTVRVNNDQTATVFYSVKN